MGYGWGLIIVTFVSLFVSFSYSQECMSACDAGLTACSSLGYKLYVTNITETLQREAIAKKLILDFKSANLYACATHMESVLCNVIHPSCNGDVPTPIKPCNKLCTDIAQQCGQLALFFPSSLQQFLNCEGINQLGQRTYAPANDTQCSSSSISTVSPCPKPETTFQFAGTCQPFNYGGLLGISAAEVCGPFVSKNVFMPINWPSVQIMANLLFIRRDYQTRFPKAFPIMPLDCYTHLSALICGSFFQTCETVQVQPFGVNALLGQYPCRSFCEKTIDKCWDFFVLTNLTYLLENCTEAYYDPSPAPYILPVGNGYALSTCRDYIFPEQAYSNFTPPVLEACPPAFGLKSEYTDSESRCGLACPDSSYTSDEWHNLVVVIRAGSSLSLILMSFLIVSYLVQYEKRKFPSAIHFWEFVATAGFAISFLINGDNPEKDVWCKDPATYATQGNNSACAAQGFLFIFFGLALAAWCLVIAFIIFYGVVQNKKVSNLTKFSKFYHLFSWGLPLAFAIAAIASNKIGYGPPLAWCFIHFEGFGYNDGTFSADYPLFYIPMLVMFVVILVLFICTVVKIIKVRKMRVASGNKSKSSRTFQAQVRVLIFILVVFVICFSIFEWRFEIEGTESKEAVGIAWAYCKLQIALEIPVDPTLCPGDTNPARIEYSRTVGESFVLSGIGLLIFVGFGADIGIYKHWYKIFKLAYMREWKQLKELIVLGKDPFTPNSSNKTKSNSNNSTPTLSKDKNNTSNDSSNSNSNSKPTSAELYNDENMDVYVSDSRDVELDTTTSKSSKAEVYMI